MKKGRLFFICIVYFFIAYKCAKFTMHCAEYNVLEYVPISFKMITLIGICVFIITLPICIEYCVMHHRYRESAQLLVFLRTSGILAICTACTAFLINKIGLYIDGLIYMVPIFGLHIPGFSIIFPFADGLILFCIGRKYLKGKRLSKE